jgi:hypothetical protein
MMGLPGRQEREGLGVRRLMMRLKPLPPGLVNARAAPGGVSPHADPA